MLRNDKRAIFKAASLASKAADFILDFENSAPAQPKHSRHDAGIGTDRLTVLARPPCEPKRNPNAQQKSRDHGLFDEVSRSQLDLCDLITQSMKETVK